MSKRDDALFIDLEDLYGDSPSEEEIDAQYDDIFRGLQRARRLNDEAREQSIAILRMLGRPIPEME